MPSRPVHVLRGTVCRAHVLCLCQSHAKPVPHSMYTTDRIHITSTSLPPLPAWRPWTSTPTSTPSASLEDQVNKLIKCKFKLQHSLPTTRRGSAEHSSHSVVQFHQNCLKLLRLRWGAEDKPTSKSRQALQPSHHQHQVSSHASQDQREYNGRSRQASSAEGGGATAEQDA